MLAFSKYHGLGNDFIVVEGPAPSAAAAKAICDRHRGIGGDGLIAIQGLGGGTPAIRIINADGSEPEMCGNGVRCVALHLFRRGSIDTGAEATIGTLAGPHRCQVMPSSDTSAPDPAAAAEVRVTMAVPAVGAKAIGAASAEPLIDTPTTLLGHTLKLTAVSMGNPHVVAFGVPEALYKPLGEALASHRWFPQGVNVGFAQATPAGLQLDVLERGAGWTQACGTGACAAAVAAVHTGRVTSGTPLSVTLLGGRLTITAAQNTTSDASGYLPVQMTGPAVHVFDGTFSPALV